MAMNVGYASVTIKPNFSGFNKEINRTLGGSMPKAGRQMSKSLGDAGTQAGTKASKGFAKSFALGGAIAGVTASLTSTLTGMFGGFISEAAAASDATNKFVSTMKFAGTDTKAIDKATASAQKYADETVYALSDIQSTMSQLASNGIKDYEGLAKASGNLNAVAGGNAETYKSVSMVMTQTAGAGKLTTENFNQLADAVPGASGKIQEALKKNGAYTGNFRDAMADGAITADEFNKVILELGNKPVAVEAAKSTATFEGALGNLQATIVGGLTKAMNGLKPLLTGVINGASSALGSLVDGASGLAAKLAPGLDSAKKGWAEFKTSFSDGEAPKLDTPFQTAMAALGATLGQIGRTFAPAFQAVGQALAPIIPQLVQAYQSFSPLSLIMQALMPVMPLLAQMLQAVGQAVGAILPPIIRVAATIQQALVPLFSTLISSILPPVIATISKIAPIFSQIVQAIAPVITTIVGVLAPTLQGLIPIVTGVFTALIAVIRPALDVVVGIVRTVTAIITGNWAGAWRGIGGIFVGAWNLIVSVVRAAVAVVVGVVAAFVNNIKGAWQYLWNTVVSLLRGAWNWVKSIVSGGINAVKTTITNVLNIIKTVWSTVWNAVKTTVTNIFTGIKSAVSNAINSVKTTISTVIGTIKTIWSAGWTWAKTKVTDIFNGIKSIVSNAINGVKNTISNVWNNGIKPIFTTFGNFINDKVAPVFKKGVEFIGKIWEGIQDTVKKPIKWVIDTVINGGIIDTFNKVAGFLNIGKIERISIPGFARGGWTGPGGKYQEAGVVHADEYVIRKESQRRLSREQPGLLSHLNKYGRVPGYAKGGLVRPTGGTYTSRFGANRGGYSHQGLDMAVPVGTPVVAAMDGTVMKAGWNAVAGRTGIGMFLSHSGGRNTYYGHLSQALAQVGQQVQAGQVIGRSGNTGRSTGPHLHFETWSGGKPINPEGLLAGAPFPEGQSGGGGGWNPLQPLLDFGNKIKDWVKNQFPGGGFAVDMAFGSGMKVFNGVKDWALDKLRAIGDWFTGGRDKGAGQYKDIAAAALRHTGDYSEDNLSSLLRRMKQESTYNPRAINNSDSNARRGTPSKGLMQVIDPTFNAYRDRSLSGDIYDPMANIVASINYTKSRYGSLRAGWDRAGGYSKGGLVKTTKYDSGGWLTPGITPVLNATGKKEAIFTDGQWRSINQLAKVGANTVKSSNGDTYNVYANEAISGQDVADTIRFSTRRNKRR